MNEMLKQYNDLVETARSIGLIKFRPIKRFRPANSGPEKIAQIEAALGAPAVAVSATVETVADSETPVLESGQQEDTTMAKAKKVKAVKAPKVAKTKAAKSTTPAKRGRPPSNGVTIAAKTEELNKLVPALKKAGASWAKHHTSFFGSHTAADAQLKKAHDFLKNA